MKPRRLKTWLKHLGLDALIVLAVTVALPAWAAFGLVAAWRFVREVVQQAPKASTNTVGQWVGALGDVGSGWIGGGFVWAVLTITSGAG